MDAANIRAYRLLRGLLQRADCSLDRLGELINYHFETIRSWGKRGRGFPDDPVLLGKIVRLVVSRVRTVDAALTRDAVQFLLLAGVPTDHLRDLSDCFPPDLFQAARQAALVGDDSLLRAQGLAQALMERLQAIAVTTLPPPQPLPPGSIAPPYPPYPRFRGRAAMLIALAHALGAGKHVALTGMGGIGKTLLVSELIHRFGTAFPGGVFWFNAEQMSQLPAQIARCGAADALALHPGFATLDQAAQLTLVQAAWAQPIPRLLVLDNVEDLAVFQLFAPYLGGSRVVLTSQRNDWQRVAGITTQPLPGLARHESIAFLAEDLTAPNIIATLGDLDRLAAEVGDLPLGLLLVGRYLQQQEGPLAQRIDQILVRLHTQDAQLLPDGPTHYARGINAIVQATLDRLDHEDNTDQRARDLLTIAACLAPGEALDPALLLLGATGHTPEHLEEPERRRYQRALERLIDLGLLERATATSLRIHRLIAAAVGTARSAALGAVLAPIWSARFATGDPAWATPYLDHLRHLTDRTLTIAPTIGSLLALELGWHLSLTGKHEAAITYQQQSLTLLHAQRGWDDASAEALCRLALAYQFCGRMAEAEHHWDNLLTIDQARLPGTSLALALTYNNVGYIKLNRAKFVESERVIRAALHIRRRQLPLRHPALARTLYMLGRLLWSIGRYRHARRLMRLAIAILEVLEADAPPSIHQATYYSMLGEIEYLCGTYTAALTAFVRAHRIRVQHFGHLRNAAGHIMHQWIALDYYSFGRVAAAQGDSAAALRYFRDALAIDEQVMGTESTETANIAECLGVWYGERGNTAQALGLLDYACEVYTHTIGGAFPERARIELAIARIHLQAEAWERAAQALVVAQQTMQQCALPQHPLCGWIAATQGDLALAQGDTATAQDWYRYAITIIAREAPHHPQLALYRLQLAS